MVPVLDFVEILVVYDLVDAGCLCLGCFGVWGRRYVAFYYCAVFHSEKNAGLDEVRVIKTKERENVKK